jgi:nucleoside 2-deoxyribosyltransferase
MIYLASPYNHPSPDVRQGRYEANVRALAALLHEGRVAFSPIVHHHPVACLRDLGRGWDFWRRVDVEYLRRCDSLIVLTLDGWRESVGVAAEIEIAQTLGLPVEHMEPV